MKNRILLLACTCKHGSNLTAFDHCHTLTICSGYEGQMQTIVCVAVCREAALLWFLLKLGFICKRLDVHWRGVAPFGPNRSPLLNLTLTPLCSLNDACCKMRRQTSLIFRFRLQLKGVCFTFACSVRHQWVYKRLYRSRDVISTKHRAVNTQTKETLCCVFDELIETLSRTGFTWWVFFRLCQNSFVFWCHSCVSCDFK